MVGEQTSTTRHNIDKNLWHRLGSLDFVHSQHEWQKLYCHVTNTALHCRTGLFQDADLAGNLQDSQSTSGGIVCIFGSRTFVPIRWICKKQTSVSDVYWIWGYIFRVQVYAWTVSSLLISDIWSLIHHTALCNPLLDEHSQERCNETKKQSNTSRDLGWTHVDYVTSNAKLSRFGALPCLFEDNEP